MSVAYLNEDQTFPGATILVLKRHATELFELTGSERARLIDDVSRVANALSEAFDAVKINYGLFGNQIPHIHWHIVPRLPGDPSPREAAWVRPHEATRLAARDAAARIADIRVRLAT